MAKKTIRTIPQERTAIPVQAPGDRVQNFAEVALGYLQEHALNECERCLLCPEPACVKACPVAIDIPGFIEQIIAGEFHAAYETLSDANLLPAICGRVCPQEDQCELVCPVGDTLEPVAIGRLERWIGDLAIEQGWSTQPYREPNGFKIGIVGSGPAGMACAADLAKVGCDVTVYEALHKAGGVLRYGIPEFRLPNEVIDVELANITNLGVKVECNTLVGRLFTIDQMVDEMGFDAVFVGTGAGSPKCMGIPGESLNGVLSANELLTRCNLMSAGEFPKYDTPLHLGKKVAIIGSGNTAMDAMRVCLRTKDVAQGTEALAELIEFATGAAEQSAAELRTAREEFTGPYLRKATVQIRAAEARTVEFAFWALRARRITAYPIPRIVRQPGFHNLVLQPFGPLPFAVGVLASLKFAFRLLPIAAFALRGLPLTLRQTFPVAL